MVTRVSTRSWTGVSERRYAGTPDGWMPCTEANARLFAGSACKELICFSTLQLATLRVPL
ncbi:hypothetical protein GCM10011579_083690 [Streptomyces albiflavescens]|uniref:Uncharacterized protein n=1 Tax=Streptomyces albiflavescens TaxID=1623582 RepID=A0A918DAA1_9ACTN|nr:hypothetical protein GCM10011579_083690 [Streptomyces albiflavescens]